MYSVKYMFEFLLYLGDLLGQFLIIAVIFNLTGLIYWYEKF